MHLCLTQHESRAASDNNPFHLCQTAWWLNLATLGTASELLSQAREGEMEREVYLCQCVCVLVRAGERERAGADSWKSDCSLWASVWQWETPNQRTSPQSTSSYWSRFNRPSRGPLIWTVSPLIGHHPKRQWHSARNCVLTRQSVSCSTWRTISFQTVAKKMWLLGHQ